MRTFTLDTTSPEAIDVVNSLARDLNTFLDDIGYLHYCADRTAQESIAGFLLDWMSGKCQRHRVDGDRATIPLAEMAIMHERIEDSRVAFQHRMEIREARRAADET